VGHESWVVGHGSWVVGRASQSLTTLTSSRAERGIHSIRQGARRPATSTVEQIPRRYAPRDEVASFRPVRLSPVACRLSWVMGRGSASQSLTTLTSSRAERGIYSIRQGARRPATSTVGQIPRRYAPRDEVASVRPVACRLWPLACCLSPVACRLSPVACRLSPVAYRLQFPPVLPFGH
jgi:hypothetical protein